MINKNLPRWCYISIVEHFRQVAEAGGIPLLVEGIEDRVSDKIRKELHAELRITGPMTKELSKGCFQFMFDVNIILQSYMTESNAYRLIQAAGEFYSALVPIMVYKLGNLPDDDGSFVGCLLIRDEVVGSRFMSHFGQLKEDVRIRQSMVGGRYQLTLTEGS